MTRNESHMGFLLEPVHSSTILRYSATANSTNSGIEITAMCVVGDVPFSVCSTHPAVGSRLRYSRTSSLRQESSNSCKARTCWSLLFPNATKDTRMGRVPISVDMAR